MNDAERERDQLREQLAAAQEIIASLEVRAEIESASRGMREFAVQKAIANLENTVAERTRALERSEARYRSLFEHSPLGNVTLDAEGSIRDANAAAQELFDVDTGLIGSAFADAFTQPELVSGLVKQDNGRAHEIELRNGKTVDVHVARLAEHDLVVVTLADVSSRVELADELQHSRRLAAIGHLCAGVAHEINNPLGVIQLELGLIGRRFPREVGTQSKVMTQHVDRIARIVENLQTFAQRTSPRQEAMALSRIIEMARALSRPSTGALTFDLDIDPANLSVEVDVGQLEQVFVNLMTNAARATEGQGRVRIVARQEKGEAVVRFSDDGPGIPDDLIEHVFTPFVTGAPMGSRAGSGLGLAITWGLVQENRGSIRAWNEDAGGACFELKLPLADPIEISQSDSSASHEDAGGPVGCHVLCVEDEPALRRALEKMLEALGHSATGVASGEEALERLGMGTFDLVITDVRLPKMTGEELAIRIAESEPSLKVVLMSGLFRPEHGRRGYLQKPFSIDELRDTIERELG